MPERSTSIFSAIFWARAALAVILIIGAAAKPMGVPRPVEKSTICAPPPHSPRVQARSLPGVSMKETPGFTTSCPKSSPFTMGSRPILHTPPRLFSSMVDSPPRMLPGEGWEPRKSTFQSSATCSTAAILRRMKAAMSGVWHSPSRISSAPMSSVVSPKTTRAPSRTKRLAAAPMAGLAAMPEV